MKKLEEVLENKNKELKQIQIPDELEVRLRKALKNRGERKKHIYNKSWRLQVASILIILFLVGYHFDTLAYYSKKLIGYDQIMNGTLRELNELGKGQIIDKSYTFRNGIIVTLDGIMLDTNQMIVFYTVKDPNGKVDQAELSSFKTIKGISGPHDMEGAYGQMNEKKTEIKYMADFEPPYFFEKNLSFHFVIQNTEMREEGQISFELDRNKAMKHMLKKNLHKSIEVDETTIQFDSIIASPTTTVIKGSLQNIVSLVKDQITGERFRPSNLEVELIANGEVLQTQGGGMSTDIKGITFERNYEALPKDLKTLQIQLKSFMADHDVSQKMTISKGESIKTVNILGQNIDIKNVYESNGDTYITIATDENVLLTKIYLVIDGEQVELQETVDSEYDKKSDGSIIHTRTLHFPGTGVDLELDIQRMTYSKEYNQIIDISID